MRYLNFRPNPPSSPPPRPHRHPHHPDPLLAHLNASASTRTHLAELHAPLAPDLAAPRDARSVLDGTAARRADAPAWNRAIRRSSGRDALAAFRAMLRRGVAPDGLTVAAAAAAALAGSSATRNDGAVHAVVRKIGCAADPFVASGLVTLYGAARNVDDARKVFEEMRERDVVSWTSMISAFARCGMWNDALRLLAEMQEDGINPNRVTIISLLSACAQGRAVDEGRWVYAQIGQFGIEPHVDIGNALIGMYAKCGCMADALEAFRVMPERNTKSWNTLIHGFVQNRKHREALGMFEQMLSNGVTPDAVTLVCSLSACAQLGDLQQGRDLHNYIKSRVIHCDTILTNSLINMYAKCGDMEAAEVVFRDMEQRDVVSWTTMVCGLVQACQFASAFHLFEEMEIAQVVANEMTLVSLLSACSQLGALDKGRMIHSYIEEKNVRKDVCLESALVDMYAKCGCIDMAAEIFTKMLYKQTLTWNSMIGGLASNGHGKEAVQTFEQMLKLGDSKPDGITFKAVLGACAHVGMVNEGLQYFHLMSSFGITPDVEHYGCIVDLLARAGLLDEAFEFIKKMPMEPNQVIWGSLLSACRFHNKTDLGRRFGRHIINLVPNDVGAHVLISNLHAEEGQWDNVQQVRGRMEGRGIEKSPGHSSVQV